jgi:hypothetical protein
LFLDVGIRSDYLIFSLRAHIAATTAHSFVWKNFNCA